MLVIAKMVWTCATETNEAPTQTPDKRSGRILDEADVRTRVAKMKTN